VAIFGSEKGHPDFLATPHVSDSEPAVGKTPVRPVILTADYTNTFGDYPPWLGASVANPTDPAISVS
jgi:hypothetical protein